MTIKKRLVRVAALAAAVLILVCSCVVPISAAGVTDGLDTLSLYSYWNLRYITVFYSDGDIAMFEFPNVFYGGNNQSQVITLTNDNATKTLDIQFTTLSDINPQAPNEVRCMFMLAGISSMRFHFVDSVIKPYPDLSPAVGNFTTVTVPYFTVDTQAVDSLNSVYSSVRPVTTLTGYDFVFANSSGTFNGIVPSSYTDGVYNLIFPESTLQAEYDFFTAQGYQGILNQWPYYNDIQTTVSFTSYGSSENVPFYVYLPLSNTTNDVYADTNFVSQFYQKYYEGVPTYVQPEYNADFTGWLGTAVGGFLSFQFVPGISLGILLLFILGIGAFHLFLKFFSGG